MGASPSKVKKTIMDLCKRKGYVVKQPPDRNVIAVISDGAQQWRYDCTQVGLNRIRRILPESEASGADDVQLVIFGHDLEGRRGLNVFSELASIGLDLRDRPGKKKNPHPQPVEPDDTPQPEAEDTPMSKAVDEILDNLSDVEELIYPIMLKSARDANAPEQWIKGKKYLDWTGDIISILKKGWDDLDENDDTQMARLEMRLPDFLRRGLRLERIHQFPGQERTAIWRIRDDGRVFADESPVPPPATADLHPETDTDVATLYTCTDCRFADFSSHALTKHNSQLRERSHPQTAYSCSQCPSVRNTVPSLQVHMKGKHGRDGSLCYSCAEAGTTLWFPTEEEYDDHLRSEHERENRRRRKKLLPGADEEAAPLEPSPAPSAPLSPREAAPAPNGHPGAERTAEAPSAPASPVAAPAEFTPAQAAALEMITRYPQLVAENDQLRSALQETKAELAREIGRRNEIEAALDDINRALGR